MLTLLNIKMKKIDLSGMKEMKSGMEPLLAEAAEENYITKLILMIKQMKLTTLHIEK